MDNQNPVPSSEPAATSAEPNAPITPNPLSEFGTTLTSPAQPKKSRKKLLIGGIIAGVLVILGGGSALAYTFWYQNPEKVVTDAVVGAIQAKTVTYTGSLTAEGDFKLKVELTGANNAATSDLVAKITFPIENKEYTLEAAARFDDKSDLYVKVKNIDKLAGAYRSALPPESAGAVDQLIAKINDRWIKVSTGDLAQFDEAASKKQKCVSDAIKKYYQDDKAMTEVADVYKKNKFITIEQKLNGKPGNLGYTLKEDEKKSEAFFKGLKDTKVYKTLNECDPEFNIEEKEAAEQTVSDETQENTVELWVDQWTHQITELKASSKDKKDTKNSVIGVLRPKFNEKVTVETPKNSVTLKQLQAEIEELMMAAMTSGTSEEATSSDVSVFQES